MIFLLHLSIPVGTNPMEANEASDNTKKAQSSYSAYTYLLIAAGI
jgi:hypothetical protein